MSIHDYSYVGFRNLINVMSYLKSRNDSIFIVFLFYKLCFVKYYTFAFETLTSQHQTTIESRVMSLNSLNSDSDQVLLSSWLWFTLTDAPLDFFIVITIIAVQQNSSYWTKCFAKVTGKYVLQKILPCSKSLHRINSKFIVYYYY